MRILLLLFLSIYAGALEVPVLTSPIEDKANLLDTCEKESLIGLLKDLNNKTGIQLQLLTIPSLQGEIIESYSIKVTDSWQLGSEKEDKGLLFLIAKNERKMRIEVGQGLEGDVTDLYSKRIIDGVGTYFKKTDFYGGIRFAFNKIISLAAPEFTTTGNFTSSQACSGFAPTGISGGSDFSSNDYWDLLFVFSAIFLFILMQMMRSANHRSRSLRGRRRDPWDDDHFGGGFGGFGGGSGGGWSGGGGGFSGGGASGGW